MPEPARTLAARSTGAGFLQSPDRCRCETTVRHVFSLIWPQAGIACSRADDGCVVDVRDGALQHRVRVPWALVELDRGLTLVRAVYRAGLPCAFERTAVALVLSL